MLRMPIVATFGGQLAKLRIVISLTKADEYNYFFWLFVVETSLVGVLAVAALVFLPYKDDLQMVCNLVSGYEVRN